MSPAIPVDMSALLFHIPAHAISDWRVAVIPDAFHAIVGAVPVTCETVQISLLQSTSFVSVKLWSLKFIWLKGTETYFRPGPNIIIIIQYSVWRQVQNLLQNDSST